ncbi:MAG: hypothetical protein ACYCOU_07980 [Sulfobacillus sp.]
MNFDSKLLVPLIVVAVLVVVIVSLLQSREDFVPDCPEPYASMSDVLTAGQALEEAIHAKSAQALGESIARAQLYLRYAHNYFSHAYHKYGDPRYLSLAQEIVDAKNRLSALASSRPTDRKSFQEGLLYSFMGDLSRVYRDIRSLWLSGSARCAISGRGAPGSRSPSVGS